MKNTPKLILIICIGQLLVSCFDFNNNKDENLSIDKDFVPIKINNEYGIKIPSYMKKTNDLNDEASLQFQNVFKEAYIVIIDESKKEFVDTFKEIGEYNDSISVAKNYRDIQLQFLHEGIDISMQSEPKSKRIHGLDAELVEIDGRVDGIFYDISYFLTFIEGEEKVYMVMAWTLKKRKEKYKKTFEKAVGSFRLLNSKISVSE
ncbi:hypothetical protein QQ008_20025 [Fulvivirgaceae bacterium BMA10]|uniref:Lipoprotein n=1 Tax=Splendidivirga corallicola TaxID=3051826 RepID=A0ABT8KVN3_9BACT|nr:hypothetical protein [Fulvivirgaceae bacterium BMA10]